jgi:hypothetical protein
MRGSKARLESWGVCNLMKNSCDKARMVDYDPIVEVLACLAGGINIMPLKTGDRRF